MKTKILTLILALAMVFSLAACNSSKEEETTTEDPAAQTSAVVETTTAKSDATTKSSDKAATTTAKAATTTKSSAKTTKKSSSVSKITGSVASDEWIKTYTSSYDGSTLTINKDKTVNVDLYRLCSMEGKVTGVNPKGYVGLDLTDPNGNALYAELNADSGTFEVKESTWEYLPVGEIISFDA